MPKAYSIDFREKVLEAYLCKEGSLPELSKRFKLSMSTIKRIAKRYRDTGKVEIYIHQVGRKRLLTEADYEALTLLVKEKQDRTLAELAVLYKERCKKSISLSSLHRALKELQLRHKKKSHYAQERDSEVVKKKS